MNLARNIGISTAVAIAIALIGVIVTTRSAKTLRAETQRAFARIQLGTPSSDLDVVFGNDVFPHLKLRRVDQNNILVQSPLEWGARNWVLWIEVESEIITAVRVRFHDNKNVRPNDAPPDKLVK